MNLEVIKTYFNVKNDFIYYIDYIKCFEFKIRT